MNRIIEQRLSPQYVSVHATDLKTRAYLLGRSKNRGPTSRINSSGCWTTISSCTRRSFFVPEINDGAILEKTLRDLAAHYPKVVSTAVVPVALTRYNTDERLTRVTPEFCRRTIREVEKLQKEFRSTLGYTFAFLGDEIYIKAGVEIPSRRHYGNYPQIEDGVGMVRSFLEGFERLVRTRAVATGFKQCGRQGRTDQLENFRSTFIPRHLLRGSQQSPVATVPGSTYGTIMTGEMFAPILRETDRAVSTV